MHNVRKVSDNIFWLGSSDRRLAHFENAYCAPCGMSYNNYIILDEKTCLMDGIDDSVSRQFLENLNFCLNGRTLDYMVVNHMEPDHCSVIPELIKDYPDMKIVATESAFKMMKQFYDLDTDSFAVKVKENDTLELGEHTLSFMMAPMVHWPEVMVAYESKTSTLFSADAFGAFGAMSGNIFSDEIDWEKEFSDEARRYYANIIGKYGTQVSALMKKLDSKSINMICPLHAHIWRKNPEIIIDKYKKWMTYTPERQSVCIYYGSVYNNTANAADILAVKLAEKGVRNVRVLDVTKTDKSELLARAFEYSHLIFAAATYNANIFDNMEVLLTDLKNHNMSNRTVGIMENGSWAVTAGSLMRKKLDELKNITVLEPTVKILSAVKEDSLQQIEELSEAIVSSLK